MSREDVDFLSGMMKVCSKPSDRFCQCEAHRLFGKQEKFTSTRLFNRDISIQGTFKIQSVTGGEPGTPRIIETRCSTCGRVAARIEIHGVKGTQRVMYKGIVGSSGLLGNEATSAEVNSITEAFSPPYEPGKIRAAGIYDDAGYCAACQSFYCFDHWNPTNTGGGWCPKGHFKSLDPNWSPED